ncbi:hypothetical protein JT05_07670 [Desulfosporosinus sp. Tol-M]|nr:hypothetical protein JT05_07670 [Desulfosporosinus sp. Tol-M]
MIMINKAKTIGYRRLFAIVSLIGAIYAAYGASSTLTWPGITWYIICIAALLLVKDPRFVILLWFAVATHIILSGYQLWLWQTQQITPCIYCSSAALCVLIATTVLYRPLLSALLVLFMIGMLCAWPFIFPPSCGC